MTVDEFIREQAAKQVATVARDALLGADDQKCAGALGVSVEDVRVLRTAGRLDSALLAEIVRRQLDMLRHLLRLVEAIERASR